MGTQRKLTARHIPLRSEAATGKEIWKGRFGGNFTASPVLVGDVI